MDERPDGASPRVRPVALTTGLGLAAFVLAFFGALLLGRGLTGGTAETLLIPLALSGALAVGLGVAFVVATAVGQPYGTAGARRALAVATPLALLLALYVSASEPAKPLREPFLTSGPSPAPSATGAPSSTGPRWVAVPTAPAVVLGVRSEAPVRPTHLVRPHSPAPTEVSALPPPPRTTVPDPIDLVPRNLDHCWQARAGRNPHSLAPCGRKP